MNRTLGKKVWLSRESLACVLLSFFSIGLLPASAQKVVAKPPVTTPSAGGNSFDGPGSVRYQPSRDVQNRRIDMFIGDWRDSMPRHLFGSLVLRDILTRGDNYAPPQPGALLQAANFLAYGRLAPGNSTTPSQLDHEQEIYYVVSGTGEITAGGKTAALHKDIAIFIPANLEFVMKNTGDDELKMYVVSEPTREGFVPGKQMLVTDERQVPVRTPMAASPYTLPGASGHWAHVVRDLFSKTDGLATIGDVITVEINPMTMGEPHPHVPGQEEIWAAIDGDSLAFLGTELRVQHPGMAYMIRPDQSMTHSNINPSDAPVKFLWFSGSSLKK
ncbi:MAG TPA: cupin domain-containing protein [Terriglobales bacterium]|nr:cupin domain-containing protein [Terriglobales bacterium]